MRMNLSEVCVDLPAELCVNMKLQNIVCAHWTFTGLKLKKCLQ